MYRMSIRTTLTVVGIILLALTLSVGALGVFAVSRAGDSLRSITHGDLVTLRTLDDVSSYQLRSRIALGRVIELWQSGHVDESAAVLKRADELLAHSNDAWKAFQAASKEGIDPALLDAANARHTELIEQGVNPEFAALHQNDMNAYHAIADTKISPMFIAFDNAVAPVEAAYEAHARVSEEAAGTMFTWLRWLIAGASVLALVIVIAIRFVLRSQLLQPLESAVQCLEHIADGDLTKPVAPAGRNEIGRLNAGLGRMQASLVKMVGAVRNGSDSIDVGAREIAMGNTDLSQRTEQQAASLQETASSMEQLTATVRQNAENARQASQLAVNASDIATRGGEVVGDVVRTMEGIASSSGRVVDIIAVIEGIAFQTNILALNAAVEAARAGEQGRGFAVVAGEVRTLAQRSASAAKEIKELINDSVGKVHDGSELVGRAGTTMEEILQAVRRVTDIMGEISAASEEQSGGIEQVNRAVAQMDQVTQQNAALVEEAAAAAASLEEQTRQLKAVVATWRISGAASDVRVAAAPKTAVAHAAAKPASGGTVKPAAKTVSKVVTKAAAKPVAKPSAAESAASADTPSAGQAAVQQPASQPAKSAAPKPARPAAAPLKPAAARAEPAFPAKAVASTADADWETF